MKIDRDKCIGCGKCIPFCPIGAISLKDEGYAEINFDECAECSNCKRQEVCPVDAIYQQELHWPRTVRSILSDVLTIAQESQISGRGTEEMKTNEVTARFRWGWAGIGIELGRPVTGSRMRDVEKVAMAVAELGGIEFEKANPTTTLMSDPKTGKFRDDVLNENVLSAIIEFPVPLERVPEVLHRLEQVTKEIDSVFTLDVATRVGPNNEIPTERVVKEAGFYLSANGKTNLGLGRPLKEGELRS